VNVVKYVDIPLLQHHLLKVFIIVLLSVLSVFLNNLFLCDLCCVLLTFFETRSHSVTQAGM
uniref:Uncharacterized protein n=1 Tax=Chlorocebus sabaeus TaxID=60711 RepID=A0A0D9RFY9_CHLSB